MFGTRLLDRPAEARDRASRAYDALAGRRPGRPWGWLVGAGLAGVAVGLAAGAASTRARQQMAAARVTAGSAPITDGSTPATERNRTVEFVDADRPTGPVSRDR